MYFLPRLRMDELFYSIGPIDLKRAKIDGEVKYALVLEKRASNEEIDLLSSDKMKHLFKTNKKGLMVVDDENGRRYINEDKGQSTLMSFEEVMVDGKLYRCYLKDGKVSSANLMHVRVLNELEEAGSALEEMYNQEE